MPEVATMRNSSTQPPVRKTRTKLAAAFESQYAETIQGVLTDIKAGNTAEATAKLTTLYEVARGTPLMDHFTIRRARLGAEQKDLLRNLWLPVNGTRGGRKITLLIE